MIGDTSSLEKESLRGSSFAPIVGLPEGKGAKNTVPSRSSASLVEGCPEHQILKISHKKKQLALGVSRIILNEYNARVEPCP
jgi:hypothetical protein